MFFLHLHLFFRLQMCHIIPIVIFMDRISRHSRVEELDAVLLTSSSRDFQCALRLFAAKFDNSQ